MNLEIFYIFVPFKHFFSKLFSFIPPPIGKNRELNKEKLLKITNNSKDIFLYFLK